MKTNRADRFPETKVRYIAPFNVADSSEFRQKTISASFQVDHVMRKTVTPKNAKNKDADHTAHPSDQCLHSLGSIIAVDAMLKISGL